MVDDKNPPPITPPPMHYLPMNNFATRLLQPDDYLPLDHYRIPLPTPIYANHSIFASTPIPSTSITSNNPFLQPQSAQPNELDDPPKTFTTSDNTADQIHKANLFNELPAVPASAPPSEHNTPTTPPPILPPPMEFMSDPVS